MLFLGKEVKPLRNSNDMITDFECINKEDKINVVDYAKSKNIKVLDRYFTGDIIEEIGNITPTEVIEVKTKRKKRKK